MSTAKEPITITHTATSSSFTIHPYGAHLTSYTASPDFRPVLFLSRDAILDGTKPIRGGIPLCFPQFGQPDPSYPQHGFLRNNYWKVVEGSAFDDDARGAGIAMELCLKDAVHARGGKWGEDTKYDCVCRFFVRIDGEGMTNALEVENTGNEAFDFQMLLHTYYLVSEGKALDGTVCYVEGLKGYRVSDKVSGEEYVNDSDEPIAIEDSIVDRVYTPLGEKVELDVVVGTGPGRKILLKANGDVDGKAVPVSGVVWNPVEKAKAMADFGDDQYNDMICVEPGLLSNVPVLEPGKRATFTQVIKSV
ncbi:hypothetical protein ACHAXS_011592 [Conticribra weissflogii]